MKDRVALAEALRVLAGSGIVLVESMSADLQDKWAPLFSLADEVASEEEADPIPADEGQILIWLYLNYQFVWAPRSMFHVPGAVMWLFDPRGASVDGVFVLATLLGYRFANCHEVGVLLRQRPGLATTFAFAVPYQKGGRWVAGVVGQTTSSTMATFPAGSRVLLRQLSYNDAIDAPEPPTIKIR